MKFFLLFIFFSVSTAVSAQTDKVSNLPAGTYEVQKSNSAKFPSNEIILLDDSHYRLRHESVISDYKFSATAQRVLFLSGSLKGAFAKTVVNAGEPAIVLPHKENQALGLSLADVDVWALYKKK